MKFVFEVIIHGDVIDAIVDKFGKKATEGALLEDLSNIIGDEAEIVGFKSEVAFIRMEEMK